MSKTIKAFKDLIKSANKISGGDAIVKEGRDSLDKKRARSVRGADRDIDNEYEIIEEVREPFIGKVDSQQKGLEGPEKESI